MLFVLNGQSVPSVAHIIRISDHGFVAAIHNAAFTLFRADPAAHTVDTVALDQQMAQDSGKPPVVIGITPTCPYGIQACWNGAFEALKTLAGIKEVRLLPNGADSTAFVYLTEDSLPDLDLWRKQFAASANESYTIRGIELTLRSSVTETNGLLTLPSNATRPAVTLAPLQASDKVQWDIHTRASWPMTPEEESAYQRLSGQLLNAAIDVTIEVVGPLKKNGEDFYIEVREFTVGA